MSQLIVENIGQVKTTINIPKSATVSRTKNGDIVFRVINQSDGDKRIVWDSRSIPEINDAKSMFNKLIEQGFVAYRCDPNGKKLPVALVAFDPLAEEIVMEEIVFTPQHMVVGG